MNEPRNDSVAYERADVDIRAVMWFVTALAVGIAVVMVFLVVLYSQFDVSIEQQRAARGADRQSEVMRGKSSEHSLPPQPRLEGLGKLPVGQEIGRMQPELPHFPYDPKRDDVNEWRWADASHSVACIPISEAMTKMLQKPETYFKARNEAKPSSDGGVR